MGYNKYKYHNGNKTIISERTWAIMSPEKRLEFSESPDSLNPKTIGENIQEIKLKPKTADDIQAEIDRLMAQKASLEGDTNDDMADESKEFDPYELEVEPLRAWLQDQGIEVKATIKKLETLQKLIP